MASETDDIDYEYSDEYYDYSDDDDAEMMDPAETSEYPDAAIEMPHESGIQMLAAEELRPQMTRQLIDIMEALSVSAAGASVLLREYKWSKEALLEAYMQNAEKVMKVAGVYCRCGHPIASPKTTTCDICYDDDVHSKISMPCGHAFCYQCWHDFCVNAILEGPICVKITCPHAGCSEVVTEEEMKKALGEGSPDLQKFYSFQLQSFVESNKLTRWCPGRGCERVACALSESALSESAMESEGNVAYCECCTVSFCLKCGGDPHAPVSCKELGEWNEKCRNESETANWILANTKSCPNCGCRIEKNQGCNHMTCRRCKHEFCWICMGDWNKHGSCNRYDQPDAAKAKLDLDRYLHHYNRFHAHQEAEAFAKKQLNHIRERMSLVQKSSSYTRWADVEFLKKAKEQLVKCRGVLKYTYVFGYYLDSCLSKQRQLFEYHQEMLEKFTEELSELSEKSLPDRTDVVNQTRVVDNFMKKILKYVEGGMDVI